MKVYKEKQSIHMNVLQFYKDQHNPEQPESFA